MEDDGFQLVRSKRRRAKRPPFFQCQSETDGLARDDGRNSIVVDVAYVEQIKCKLLRYAEEVQCSDYFSVHLLPCLKRCFFERDVMDLDIVCYGLGKFSRCQIAAYQFALLFCLNTTLNVKYVYVYDPVFTTEEQMVVSCDRFGFQLIRINESCRRTVHRPTLFYMPHCDRQLYENLLAANLDQNLTCVTILGNSLTRLRDTSTRSEMDVNLPHIANCFEYLDEYSIRNDFKYSDVFNDTSIHVFNKKEII